MMRKFSARLTAILISLSIAGAGVILGCAGGWWSIADSTNFTPEIFVDSVYKPFFFSNEAYYYDINYDEAHNHRFNQKIVSEWSAYFDNKISRPELEQMLFLTTDKSIDSLIKGIVPAYLKSNKLVTLKDKKVDAFIRYLRLAKQAEKFALANPDDWVYYDKPAVKRVSTPEFCSLLGSEFEKSKDKFIKPRLWFQYVRATFFNEAYKTCITAFEKSAKEFSGTSVYYRCLSYAAGACKKSGNISKANYYYSLVYENEPLMKTVAHYSFKPQEEKDWQQTLQLAGSVNEKCVLWQMLGVFYSDEVRSVKEILVLDPKSEKIPLLLTRAVNSIESAIFSLSSADLDTTYAKKEIQKSKELRVVCKSVLEKSEVANPHLWHMTLGYLETLNGNYKEAEKQLTFAKKASSQKLAISQARELMLINTLCSLKKIDKRTEDALLPEFRWLQQTIKDSSQKILRTYALSQWMRKTMAKKYRDQGDFLKAEFFEKTDKYYTNENDLHEMQRFLLRQTKASYEQYCAEVYELKLTDLYEYEAITKTLQDKIDEAVVLMEKAGSGASVELLSNPFNGGIKDCHDCDHAKPQKIKYSKLFALKKMKEMKDNLLKDQFNNSLLLANAFYNMTYYGSSRLFYDNRVVAWDNLEMDLATKYYTMAFQSASTAEQKAKCVYMLAKCERNSIITKKGIYDEVVIAHKNYAELKKYSDTKYFREVIAECGWFKKYMK